MRMLCLPALRRGLPLMPAVKVRPGAMPAHLAHDRGKIHDGIVKDVVDGLQDSESVVNFDFRAARLTSGVGVGAKLSRPACCRSGRPVACLPLVAVSGSHSGSALCHSNPGPQKMFQQQSCVSTFRTATKLCFNFQDERKAAHAACGSGRRRSRVQSDIRMDVYGMLDGQAHVFADSAWP